MSPLRNGQKRRISQREWRLALWTCLSATPQHSRPFFRFEKAPYYSLVIIPNGEFTSHRYLSTVSPSMATDGNGSFWPVP